MSDHIGYWAPQTSILGAEDVEVVHQSRRLQNNIPVNSAPNALAAHAIVSPSLATRIRYGAGAPMHTAPRATARFWAPGSDLGLDELRHCRSAGAADRHVDAVRTEPLRVLVGELVEVREPVPGVLATPCLRVGFTDCHQRSDGGRWMVDEHDSGHAGEDVHHVGELLRGHRAVGPEVDDDGRPERSSDLSFVRARRPRPTVG